MKQLAVKIAPFALALILSASSFLLPFREDLSRLVVSEIWSNILIALHFVPLQIVSLIGAGTVVSMYLFLALRIAFWTYISIRKNAFTFVVVDICISIVNFVPAILFFSFLVRV
ncbi:MAG: hypothetical protein CMO55_12670 [Verrucomicrobiales bacterium]|nr:hypothetical protein [Verrucomicrobiales bacterium]